MKRTVLTCWRRCSKPGCNGYSGSGGLCPAHKAQAERLAAGVVAVKRVTKRGFPRCSGAVAGSV